MAVIIGDIVCSSEPASAGVKPFTWLAQWFGRVFTGRHNPSSFPDKVWQRHSALLDAGKRRRLNRLAKHS